VSLTQPTHRLYATGPIARSTLPRRCRVAWCIKPAVVKFIGLADLRHVPLDMEHAYWKPVPPSHLIVARAGRPVALDPFPEISQLAAERYG
jgi:hypothetical protein